MLAECLLMALTTSTASHAISTGATRIRAQGPTRVYRCKQFAVDTSLPLRRMKQAPLDQRLKEHFPAPKYELDVYEMCELIKNTDAWPEYREECQEITDIGNG